MRKATLSAATVTLLLASCLPSLAQRSAGLSRHQLVFKPPFQRVQRVPTFGNILFPGTPPGQPLPGFGNILFPGTPPLRRDPFSAPDSTFVERFSATVSGFPPFTGTQVKTGSFRRSGFIPLAVPVFVGGVLNPAPQPVAIISEPSTPSQVVININVPSGAIQTEQPKQKQDNSSPAGVRVFTAPTSPPAPAQPSKVRPYLVAFRDGSVISVAGYWIHQGIFHYLTLDNEHFEVPVEKIDIEETNRLNEQNRYKNP